MTTKQEQVKIFDDINRKGKGAEKTAKPAERSGFNLPPGIHDGVVELSSWDSGRTKKNQDPYVILKFVVQLPESHAGKKTAGLQPTRVHTFAPVDHENYQKTIEECFDEFLADLQCLCPEDAWGAVEEEFRKGPPNWPNLLNQLVGTYPAAYFRSWKAKSGNLGWDLDRYCEEYSGKPDEKESAADSQSPTPPLNNETASSPEDDEDSAIGLKVVFPEPDGEGTLTGIIKEDLEDEQAYKIQVGKGIKKKLFTIPYDDVEEAEED